MRSYPASLAWGGLDPESLPEVHFQPHGYLFLATKVLPLIMIILMMNNINMKIHWYPDQENIFRTKSQDFCRNFQLQTIRGCQNVSKFWCHKHTAEVDLDGGKDVGLPQGGRGGLCKKPINSFWLHLFDFSPLFTFEIVRWERRFLQETNKLIGCICSIFLHCAFSH